MKGITRKDYDKRRLPRYYFADDYSIDNKNLFTSGEEYPTYCYGYDRLLEYLKKEIIIRRPKYRVTSFLQCQQNVLVLDNRDCVIAHCYCFTKNTNSNDLTLEQAEQNAKDICNFLNERDEKEH